MVNLRLSLWDIRCHAEEYMKQHGISYAGATPQSMCDSWTFWDCKNVPEHLPKGLSISNADPERWFKL